MRPPGRRTTPSTRAESGPEESFRGDDTSMTRPTACGPRIGGRVVIDARTPDEWSYNADRRIARLIEGAEFAPAGADVVLVVAARQHPSLALDYLRANGSHLGSITVEAPDGETVGRWIRGLRDGVAVSLR